MRIIDVYRRAEAGIRLGSAGYAADLCERVLETFPHDPRARTLLGQAYLELGRFDDARRQCEHVLERDPECLPALSASGVAHSELGNLGAAVRAFERARELRPDDVAVCESLSQLYAQRNAAPARLSPAPPVSVVRWQLKHGETERALELAGQLLIGHPGDVLVLIARAEALWRNDRFADAERACRRLLARHPLLLKPRYILGRILASDPPRNAEGVDLLHAAMAEDAGGTIAAMLFHPGERDTWRDETFHLPALGHDLVLPLPERLTNPPFDLTPALAALDEAAAAADDWTPPAMDPVSRAVLAAEAAPESPTTAAIPNALAERPPRVGETAQRLVAVTCRAPLTARHGAEGYQRLERRLQALTRELADLGTQLDFVALDDELGPRRYGIEPIEEHTPGRIKEALDGILGAVPSPGEAEARPSTAVLILGGDEIVPFFRLPNPTDDDDPEVVTDNPYAVAPGDSILTPSIPLGRFPDGSAGNLTLLLRQLDGLLELRRRLAPTETPASLTRAGLAALNALVFGRAGSDALACTMETARPVAEQVAEAIAPSVLVRASPPITVNEFDARWLANRRCLYFNLHGLEATPFWYGQAALDPTTDQPELPPVLGPDLLAAEDLSAPIVFAETSYAGQVVGKSPTDSLALRFLSEGAAAVLGPTGATYGAADLPVASASLLARLFFRLARGGYAVGAALQLARRELVRIASERQGYLDGDDQKVLLQYVLFGDPFVALATVKARDPEDLLASPVTVPPCLCNRSAPTIGTGPAVRVRRAAVEHLLDVCPEVADGSIRVALRGTCAGGCDHPIHRAVDAEPVQALQVTAKKELTLADGGRIQKIARLTVSPEGDVTKSVVSR